MNLTQRGTDALSEHRGDGTAITNRPTVTPGTCHRTTSYLAWLSIKLPLLSRHWLGLGTRSDQAVGYRGGREGGRNPRPASEPRRGNALSAPIGDKLLRCVGGFDRAAARAAIAVVVKRPPIVPKQSADQPALLLTAF